jgi:hypothetical protein
MYGRDSGARALPVGTAAGRGRGHDALSSLLGANRGRITSLTPTVLRLATPDQEEGTGGRDTNDRLLFWSHLAVWTFDMKGRSNPCEQAFEWRRR